MKMAKADKADLDMAMELCGAIEALIGWSPNVPEAVERLDGDEESERFDRDNREQCVRVLGYLLDLAERASLMRVVWGCAVLLDPRNKCVDPDADTLEHHPDLVNNTKAAERYLWLRGRDLDAIKHGGVFAGRTPDNVVLNGDDLDAAIDSAMAGAMPADDQAHRGGAA